MSYVAADLGITAGAQAGCRESAAEDEEHFPEEPHTPRLATASGGKSRYPDAMPEDATAVELRPHARLLHGMRRPANWLQLVRFGLVGGLGFIVNLAVYALFVHPLGVDYRVAAVAAWIVAVLNNFVLNRHWTFDARDGRAQLPGDAIRGR